MGNRLPIEAHQNAIVNALSSTALVLSSPTGSGKSTMVPQWCPPPVLVVEPRRVACRSLAGRVAELDGTKLGTRVGFHVRGEQRVIPSTEIVFATPGIALRSFDKTLTYQTVIIDEFHERQLETDLLLALLRKRRNGNLVVMSATIEGDRVASYLKSEHLSVEGRMHPVEVRYLPGNALLPDRENLDRRVRNAIDRASTDTGDILVFLPGKAEIIETAQALHDRPEEILELHGGLSLKQQARAFNPGSRRRVILATNVAETSITLPRIGVVIDSGLVRRTRFHQNRGYLTLSPIALDSAEQRAGRAGRLGPGVCYRLFSESAKLESTTPPAIHRESLTRLVMSAAACGEQVGALTWLDEPKSYAIEAAVEELQSLGVIDGMHRLTARGKKMFGLPLDPHLARLLVEARGTEVESAAVDLVSALAVGRPLLSRRLTPEDAWFELGCDASVLIAAVRDSGEHRNLLSEFAVKEARQIRKRLRSALNTEGEAKYDRLALLACMIRADPRSVYVARGGKKRVMRGAVRSNPPFSNGGTEVLLGRESLLSEREDLKALVAVDTRALGLGKRDSKLIISQASPISYATMAQLGLGRDRVAATVVEKGVLTAKVQRVYAKRVIDEREEVPTGKLAQEALTERFLSGAIFRKSLPKVGHYLQQARLAFGLQLVDTPPLQLQDWVLQHVQELGFESGHDLLLLSASDFLPPSLPYEVQHVLDDAYPTRVELGDASYLVEYDLKKKQVILKMVRGHRTTPPQRSFLPKFRGFRIFVEAGRRLHAVR